MSAFQRPKKIIVPKFPKEKMKKIWEEKFGEKSEVISKNLPFRKYVLLAILINLLVVVAVAISQPILPPDVPLFYGLPEGESQLASSWFLVLPALFSLFFVVVNALLANLMAKALAVTSVPQTTTEFSRKVLSACSLAVSFFSTITTIKIIFLVGI